MPPRTPLPAWPRQTWQVFSRGNQREIVGLVSQRELLRARERLLEEERRRERGFRLRVVAPQDPRPLSLSGSRAGLDGAVTGGLPAGPNAEGR